MKSIKAIYLGGIVALCVSLSACNDEGLTEYERQTANLKELIGGNFDTSQYWKTAVEVKVTVNSTNATTVKAYSINQGTSYIFDSQTADPNGTVTITIPQGYGNNFTLKCNNGIKTISQIVTLTGAPKQSVVVDFSASVKPRNIDAKYAVNAALYGNSFIGSYGYTDFGVDVWKDITETLIEKSDPSERGETVNYELISNGPFYVSMLYGNTGCYSSRILGYYYHTAGTYNDITFVDMTETMKYDYIDNYAKIQYQLAGIDKWYDSDFDFRDGYDAPYTTETNRLNDDVYNALAVYNKYGTQITAVRGLTFKVDVPVGKRIGFYLKFDNLSTVQRKKIVQLGIPTNLLPTNFYETNFTAKALNVDSKHRSCIKANDNFTFMGMEDASTNGDYDCNDVIFGLKAKVETEEPTIVEPDVDNVVAAVTPMPWTIAFEDLGRKGDFDFNDAVIKIVPDYEKQTVNVYACAVGSDAKYYLHYDGPDGDKEICEIHEALGGGTYINTTSSKSTVAPVLLATEKWPLGYTISNDANRFYVVVRRGCCDEMITLNTTPGITPQAICVAGEWGWPKEGVDIVTAYSNFKSWSKDMTNRAYWTWTSYPESGKYVSPWGQ